ncbi:hypothetical protein V6N13_067943 [Hibiscus sabdariffa]
MSTTGRGRHSVLRIFKGRRGRTGHHATCGALPAAGPYLRLSRFQGGQALKQKDNSSRGPRRLRTPNVAVSRRVPFSFEYLLLPPRSAPTAAPHGLTPRVLRRPPRPPTHRGLALPRRPGIGHALKRHPFSGLVDSADERFARQYRCGPPPEFPLLRPRSGIVHHLSGPDRHALTLKPFSEDQDSLVRVSRRAGWGARRPTPGARWCEARRDGACWVPRSRRRRLHGRIKGPRAWAATTIRVGPRPEADRRYRLSPFHIRPGRIAGPHRFPPGQFQALFDSLFKVLFIFPSRYLFAIGLSPVFSLDGIYRPIRAAFPNNPTRRQRLVVRQGPGTTGLSPSPAPLSRGLGPGPSLRDASPDYIRTPRATILKLAIPGSLAVTKGILAGFDNDPSAGSPTETLLRLLLPLNDKVQWTSRDVAGSEPPTSPRSEHFTGPFNRAGGTTRPIKARSASPAVGTSRPVLTVRRTGRPTPRSNYELFNCNNLNIRYWSWNYRGCWHQTCPPMDPR